MKPTGGSDITLPHPLSINEALASMPQQSTILIRPAFLVIMVDQFLQLPGLKMQISLYGQAQQKNEACFRITPYFNADIQPVGSFYNIAI